jgi:long-subunit fatty acid transport protein
MGGAGVATVHDGSSPWYNPAGLGRVTEEGISATLNVYGAQFEQTKNFVSGSDLTGWKTAIFPGSLGYVKPLGIFGDGNRHAVGLAVVVPDFSRHQVALDAMAPNQDEDHIREQLLEQTLWIVPGWGACFGPRLCAGVSLQVGYWSAVGLYSEFLRWSADPTTNPPTPAFSANSMEQDDFGAVLAGMSAGVQYQATDHTWIGLSIRSPVRTIWGSGSILYMDSDSTGALRRANDNQIKIDERLPLNIRLGVGLDLQDWLLAADIGLSLPESTYESVQAHDGTIDSSNGNTPALKATDGTLVDIGVSKGRSTVINLSLGAQYRVSSKTAFQAGFFTDFSGQPDALIDELHPHLNRYGITAGVSLKGESSTTIIGLVATMGTGRSYGINDQGTETRADVQSEAIYLTLGGSTRLGEAPAKPQPASPEPSEAVPPGPEVAPRVQRDVEASPSSLPEQAQSAKSSQAKKKAKKTRKKDSE